MEMEFDIYILWFCKTMAVRKQNTQDYLVARKPVLNVYETVNDPNQQLTYYSWLGFEHQLHN